MTKANDLAFNDSIMQLQSMSNDDAKIDHPPLTKREYFASMAMQGILAGSDCTTQLTKQGLQTTVEDSIALANALISALNQSQPTDNQQ